MVGIATIAGIQGTVQQVVGVMCCRELKAGSMGSRPDGIPNHCWDVWVGSVRREETKLMGERPTDGLERGESMRPGREELGQHDREGQRSRKVRPRVDNKEQRMEEEKPGCRTALTR